MDDYDRMHKEIEEIVENLDFDEHKDVDENKITARIAEFITDMDPKLLATLIGPELANEPSKQKIWDIV